MDDDISEIARRESDYQSARFVSKLISFLGWLLVLVGIGVSFLGEILFVLGFESSGTTSVISPRHVKFVGVFVSIMPGVLMSLIGLAFVAVGQVTRAVVDNADYTRMLLRNVHQGLVLQLKNTSEDFPND